MSDIVRKVITLFTADSTNYKKAVDSATKETQELTDAQKQQQKTQTEASKSNEKYASGVKEMNKSIGEMIPGLQGVSQGFDKAGKAAKAFGVSTAAAIAATGIGALIILAVKLQSTFTELSSKTAGELTFFEKKFLDAGVAAKEAFGPSFEATMKVAREALDKLTFGLSEFILKLYEANKAFNENQIQIKKNQAERIAVIQQEIDILKIQKASKEEIRAAEDKLFKERISQDAYYTEAENKAITRKQRLLEATRTVEDADAAAKTADSQRLADEALFQAKTDMKNKEAEEDKKRSEEKLQWIMDDAKAIMEIDKQQADQTIANLTQEKELEDASVTAYLNGLKAKKEATDALDAAFGKSLIGRKFNAAKEAFMDGKTAIMKIWAAPGNFFVKLGQTAFMAGVTIKNIKDILGVQFTAPAFEEGGQIPRRGGVIRGRRHYHGGVKFRVGGYAAEAEGGEFIVNRKATKRFLPILQKINATGVRKYAEGGELMMGRTDPAMFASDLASTISQNRPVLVVEDYRRTDNRLNVIENLAKL